MRVEARGGGGRRAALSVLVLVASLALAACLPRERINADCRWVLDTATFPPDATLARRAHVREDVRVAKDLGIRYADVSAGRMNTAAWRQAVTSCTERSFATIIRLHGVSRAEITAAGNDRQFWIDLLAVFLPMAVLFVAASRAVVTLVVVEYNPDDRRIAGVVLAAIAPLAAALGLALTQMWGTLIEQLRLRNGHVSYRTFELPASRHGWLLWGMAVAIFAAITIMELLRPREHSPRQRRAFHSRFG